MKTTEWAITLDGGAGELDRRDVSIPDGTPEEKEDAAIRAAVIDLAKTTSFREGDTIRISRVFA